MDLEFTEDQIKKALDEAYKKAGPNAYFANGFEAGVDFVLKSVNGNKEQAFSEENISDPDFVITETVCTGCKHENKVWFLKPCVDCGNIIKGRTVKYEK